MANSPFSLVFAAYVFLHFVLIAYNARPLNAVGLSYDFYNKSCPNVERIIHNVVSQKLREARVTAAGALRIFFHDCFVEGCDASVLIASSETNKAERDSEINLSLPGDGYDVFFRAKRAVELQCPGIVSCADVMAIATRDLVNLTASAQGKFLRPLYNVVIERSNNWAGRSYFSPQLYMYLLGFANNDTVYISQVGGPKWEVQKGRRDGLVSKASRVAGNIPLGNQTISQLISLFKSNGLSVLDMVALSGGHTIGFSHCKEFMPRIYGYNKTFDIDPTMDQDYAHSLQRTCHRKNLNPDLVALNDISTPFIFDNAYYRNLQKGLGLLETDQMLVLNPMTRDHVNTLAKDQQIFFNYFVAAMIKLGSIGVKTGSDGEIRQDCGSFNS